ncbi:MAG: hypothetical protein K2X57_03430 [Xanthobacteraceae bacterium]|nr:hypothetical protein [Xanthobacteraceae bacterium]
MAAASHSHRRSRASQLQGCISSEGGFSFLHSPCDRNTETTMTPSSSPSSKTIARTLARAIAGGFLIALALMADARAGEGTGPAQAVRHLLERMVATNGVETEIMPEHAARGFYTDDFRRLINRGWRVAMQRRINLWDGEFITGSQGVEHMAFKSVVLTKEAANEATVEAEIGLVDDDQPIKISRQFRFPLKRQGEAWLVDDIIELHVPNVRKLGFHDLSHRDWFGHPELRG